MNIIKLSDCVAVSAQIQPSDLAAVAAAGYKVVVNNRPDGEEGGQPSAADMASAAEQAGLEYHHMPVNAMNFPGEGFDMLSDLLDDPERPVLAFCRSGTRCANLWVASRDPAERDAAVATAQSCGFDLGFASHYLAQR